MVTLCCSIITANMCIYRTPHTDLMCMVALHYCIHATNQTSPWDRMSSNLPISVFWPYRELLTHLTLEQLTRLETALCTAEGLGSLERNRLLTSQASGDTLSMSRQPSSAMGLTSVHSRAGVNTTVEEPNQPASREVSAGTHQRSRSYDLDSRNSNRTIFEPEPVSTRGGHISTPEVIGYEEEGNLDIQLSPLNMEYQSTGSEQNTTHGNVVCGDGDGDQGTNTDVSTCTTYVSY